MNGPLKGYKVVELTIWFSGPMAGALMADWGAEVIKIEPPEGDPCRALRMGGKVVLGDTAPIYHLENRAKRSLVVDLKNPQGREIVYRLIKDADVFLTNLRSPGLEKLRMDYESLKKVNPRLIYTFITGYGIDGPDKDAAAYDVGTFWARGGVADCVLPPNTEPLFLSGAIGDHTAALAAVSGTCAALLARGTTGDGQLVEASLFRAASYFLSAPFFQALRGAPLLPNERKKSANPLINCYKDSEGRWFWLMGLQGDRHWPPTLRAIGREDLRDDPRFADMKKRGQNNAELVAILDQEFAQRPISQWGPIFDRENVWWNPVQTVTEVIRDRQAQGAGLFMDVPSPSGTMRMPAGPCDFYGTPWEARGAAAEFGEHTEQILLEAGYSWEEIAKLKEDGALP